MLRVILNTIFCAVLFIGCEKEVNDERLRVTPSNIEIGCEGGTVQVDIESTSGWEVIVESDCTWVKSDRYESEVGRRQWIKLTISKNNTEKTRNTTITIRNSGQSRDITITQTPISLNISPESIDASQEKTTKDISINSNISWSAKSSDSWITISKSSGDVGYSKTTITIAKNTTANSRTGYVEIYNKDYNVSKKIAVTQKVASLTINPGSIDVGAESITKKITIESNIEWSVNSNANWITLSKSSGTAGTTTLNVNIEANKLASSRTGQITVYNQDYNITKKIVVNQAASTISVSTNSIEVGPESSTQNVNITSNIPWMVRTSDSWITLSKSSGYAGTTILTINIGANTSTSSRSGYIEISNAEYGVSKRIEINQTAFCPELKVSHDTLNVEADAITKIITIESNIPWSASVSDNWISLSKSSSSVGNDAIILTIEQNTTSIARTGYVDISNSEYNISRRINIQQNGYTPIEYTSTSQITIDSSAYFGALIVSHTWNNGNGVIRFDGPVTCIGDYAFDECSSLTSINIPESVTSIGDHAFNGCSSLKSITIPNSVTTIGEYAFYYCSSLTSITIPNSVTSIGRSAFAWCESLTSITIPNSVTSIGDYAFNRCSSLTSITIPNGVTSIGDDTFFKCSSLTSITIPNSVTSIGDGTFACCSSLTSITIPNSVTSIGRSAFWSCSSLTSITIPNSVTSIGSQAFYGCSSLKSITIPNSVTSIGSQAFDGCSSLTSITIPNSVTSIGSYAFSDCSNLTSITIPNSVTSIGGSAFDGCSSLTSVYCKATTPPVLGGNVFDGNASGRKIYVPQNSISAYKSASGWCDYAWHIVCYDF